MSDDAVEKLDEREFAELLKQAVTRESTDAGRPFTLQDLLKAGDELGLQRDHLEAAYREHVARKRDRSLRPPDTSIELETIGNRLTLHVPRRGLRGSQLIMFGFALFWLFFISFWTWGALRGGIVFAAFSAPFWLVGMYLLLNAARAAWQQTWLELRPEGGRLVAMPFGPRVELRPEILQVSEGIRPRLHFQTNEPASPSLLLEHGTRTFSLLEGFSEAERRWIRAELQNWLTRVRGKT